MIWDARQCGSVLEGREITCRCDPACHCKQCGAFLSAPTDLQLHRGAYELDGALPVASGLEATPMSACPGQRAPTEEWSCPYLA